VNTQKQTKIQQSPSLRTHRASAPELAPPPGKPSRASDSSQKAAPLLACLAALCALLFFSGCSSVGYSVDLYPTYRPGTRQVAKNQSEVATVILGHGVTAESIDGRKEPGWAASKNPLARTLIAIDLRPGQHTFTLSSQARDGGSESVAPTTFTANLQAGKVYLTRFHTLNSNTYGTRHGRREKGVFYADNELADSMHDRTTLRVSWFLEPNLPVPLKEGVQRVRTLAQEPLQERVIHSETMFSMSEVYKHIQPNVRRQKRERFNPFVIQ
jgi:hypothetical protein